MNEIIGMKKGRCIIEMKENVKLNVTIQTGLTLFGWVVFYVYLPFLIIFGFKKLYDWVERDVDRHYLRYFKLKFKVEERKTNDI